MAHIADLLRPLARARLREFRALESAVGHPFVAFSLLIFATQPASGRFLVCLVGLILLVTLGRGPLDRVPAERRALLPLTTAQWRWIRVAGVCLNPSTWLALGFGLYRGMESWDLMLALVLVGFAVPLIQGVLRRWPRFPDLRRGLPHLSGAFGILLRKELGEALFVLDTWLALAIALAACGLRWMNLASPEVRWGASLMIVLALSGRAQRLVDKDEMPRYRLLPMQGWRILLAKDLAFIVYLMILAAPAAPWVALAGGLAALAVGHIPSVCRIQSHRRWTFASGASVGWNLFQVVGIFAAGILVGRGSAWLVLGCVFVWGVSLMACGRRLESA